jgi:hypothetical protein
MYFLFIRENRRLKPVVIVIRKGHEGGGRTMEGVNVTKVYFKNICKYHNVSPHATIIC